MKFQGGICNGMESWEDVTCLKNASRSICLEDRNAQKNWVDESRKVKRLYVSQGAGIVFYGPGASKSKTA